MKTELILVGKTINKHFIAGIKDYAERITHYMPFTITTIPELKNTKSLSEQQQKEREGELILKQLQPSDTVVLMDEHGQEFRSIRMFIDSIGYTKFDALNDMALLEASVREDLNKKACRVSAVLDPVKLVITNYPEGESEEMEAINNPENEADGTHTITFSKNLWIERGDFMEDAPKKFFRMTPGKEVRLKNAYIVKCTGCTKDAEGNIVEIQAEYDPISKSGMEGANRKVKGTLHWVSADHCVKAEVREYDRLFNVENPSADERDFRELLNPESLHTFTNCYVEEYAAAKKPGEYLQFQRIGYFMADLDTTAEHPVFNKTVGLKDTWAKLNK